MTFGGHIVYFVARVASFATTLALKWYPQDLIGRTKLFDISAANQNQGGKYIFSTGITCLSRKKTRFTKGLCHLTAHVNNNSCSLQFIDMKLHHNLSS